MDKNLKVILNACQGQATTENKLCSCTPLACLTYILLLASCILVLNADLFPAVSWEKQMEGSIAALPGLEKGEKTRITSGVIKEFGKILKKNDSISSAILKSVTAMISTGIFEEAALERISETAAALYQAEKNGAPTEEAEEIAQAGLASKITAEQIEHSAKGLKKLRGSKVAEELYTEIISYSLDKKLPGKTVYAVSEALIRALSEGLPAEKLALGIVLSIEQEDGKSISEIIRKEFEYLRKSEARKTKDEKRRDTAYEAMKKAVAVGFNQGIAYEVFQIAVENDWPEDTIVQVFNGLARSVREKISPEKIAMALILRVEQGFEGRAKKMVEEELAAFRKIDKKIIDIKKGEITGVNKTLMEDSFSEFLKMPTPYKWGGMSRKGTDCSGFTGQVYLDHKLQIPRVSRDQAKTGKPVEKKDLVFGDLLFFNKAGKGTKIDHVAIYIGNGKFIHSSAGRKCVNICELDKSYYIAHYAGARRVLSK